VLNVTPRRAGRPAISREARARRLHQAVPTRGDGGGQASAQDGGSSPSPCSHSAARSPHYLPGTSSRPLPSNGCVGGQAIDSERGMSDSN